MLTRELITEDSSMPLWASLIQKGLDKGVKFYFGAGGNRIVLLSFRKTRDSEYIVLHLEHKDSRKKQTYTVWGKSYDGLTLKKHEDGFVLRFRKDTEPVKESVEEPMVVSMFKKLRAAGEKVVFRNLAGKETQVKRVATGEAPSGAPVWWFYDRDSEVGARALTWRVGDAIDKLSLKKEGDHWLLYDKTIKLKEEAEQEPLIVRLINNRLAKGGAVLVDVAVLPAGKRLKGWVTRPIEPVRTMSGLAYKLVTNDHPSGARGRAFYLMADADSTYTLKVDVDGKGNKVVKLVNR